MVLAAKNNPPRTSQNTESWRLFIRRQPLLEFCLCVHTLFAGGAGSRLAGLTSVNLVAPRVAFEERMKKLSGGYFLTKKMERTSALRLTHKSLNAHSIASCSRRQALSCALRIRLGQSTLSFVPCASSSRSGASLVLRGKSACH